MTTPTQPSVDTARDWPAPVEILNPAGRSPIVLLCEHASNYIPPEYAGLGLSASDRERHIAWDIGAAQVARHLSGLLDAAAFLGTYSRLLIDLNRPPGVPSSIVARSEATDVPGNASVSAEERLRREERIFWPHHAAIEAHLRARELAGRRTFIVAVHSFTPVFLGNARQWHVGVLFEKASALAEAVMARLRDQDPALLVGANVPYSVSIEEDYGLLVHGDNIGNAAILIELRQDLIAAPADAQRWAERLAPVLSACCV